VRNVAGSIVFPSAMACSRKSQSMGQGNLDGCRPIEEPIFIFLLPPAKKEGVLGGVVSRKEKVG